MQGGIRGRSNIFHAEQHVNQRCVITIDIKECFDSIKTSMVISALKKHLGLPDDLCTKLASNLCYNGRLAQGFPTSSFICNLYLLEPLTILHAEFTNKGLSFSNFVDDLAISGDIECKKERSRVIDRIFVTLRKYKLKVNKDGKIKVMPHNKSQKVCKLLVNTKLNVTREYRREIFNRIASKQIGELELRGTISYWKTVNPKLATRLRNYTLKKGYSLKAKPPAEKKVTTTPLKTN